jgi:FtsP/CotA-like multicopper oxidase with cupredoxin domain
MSKSDKNEAGRRFSRRDMLKAGAVGAAGLAAVTPFALKLGQPAAAEAAVPHGPHERSMVGVLRKGGFDPASYLTKFDTGRVSKLPSGQTLREYDIVAVDQEIEVAPGVFFAAWTYNGQVPGPTLRCTEGDRFRVHFRNAGSHPHTMHFHGIHPGNMDGVFEIVEPGESFTYDFDAEPFGIQPYHCHAVPLKRHIHKGLYGVLIIDPKQGRAPAREMVMTMNGFDTDLNGENEFYAVNTVAFHYHDNPIIVQQNEFLRIYLVNMTEFDLVNSFHLHGNYFRAYRTGSSLENPDFTDTLMLCQGERAVLEMTFKYPGKYMFHAHQSEFAELGWSGIIDVREGLSV